MNKRKLGGIAFSLMAMVMLSTGCSKDSEGVISMEEYIANNNITLTKTTPSGVGVVINNPGGAAKPSSNSTVSVSYRGYLTNNNTFDDSGSNAITFSLSNVIRGWQDGIPEFGKGGTGTLFVPAELAYGSNPPSRQIPPNADLIFDIELRDF